MSRVLMVLIALLGFNTPAFATIKGCYSRAYDKAHLAAHPKQLVRFMAFQIGLDGAADATEEDETLLMLRVRGDETMWLNGFVCISVKDGLRCKIKDGNSEGSLGGIFLLSEKADGVLLKPETDLQLTTEGEFKPVVLEVLKNPEHKVFKLKKLGDKNC